MATNPKKVPVATPVAVSPATSIAGKRPAASAKAVATKPAPAAGVDLHEQIRRRAYELYEQRGRHNGFAVQDWLQAEAEVRSRSA